MLEPIRDDHGRVDWEIVALNGVTLLVGACILSLLICVVLASLGVIAWGWS